MSENKKSFVLYNELIDSIGIIPNEDAGKIFKEILRYVNGIEPEETEPMVKALFIGIKNGIDRNTEKWKVKAAANKENGKKGGRPRKEDEEEPTETQNNPVGLLETQNNPVGLLETQNNPTESVNVPVPVPVPVNDEKNELLPKGNDPSSFAEKLNKAMNSIIPYLNEKAGTSFKANNKSTERLISARLKDGYGWYDFKAVIDGKTAEWKENKEMRAYLRPSTLFGTKFESYVQVVKAIPARRENPKGEDRNNSHGNIRFANPIL